MRRRWTIPCVLGALLARSALARAEPDARRPVDDAAGQPIADRMLTPSVVAFSPVLRQPDVGIDVVAAVHERALATAIGSGMDVSLAIARRIGPVSLAASGLLRRTIGTRDDVDLQGDVSVLVAATSSIAVGGEGRARGEVVEGLVAPDDLGRPVEVLAGGVARAVVGRYVLHALAGTSWPRGLAAPGPVILTGVSFAF